MENIVAWILLVIIGGTIAYLFISKVLIGVFNMIKENARLK